MLPPATDMSSTGIADFGTASNVLPPEYPMQAQFGLHTAMPDLGAMMFQSNDPMAYPNQPMMKFDTTKQENMGNMINGTQVPPVYPFNDPTREYDGLQAQLLGPLPLYLSQTQQGFNASGPSGGEDPMGQNAHYNAGAQPDGGVNFNVIFSGEGDGWGFNAQGL